MSGSPINNDSTKDKPRTNQEGEPTNPSRAYAIGYVIGFVVIAGVFWWLYRKFKKTKGEKKDVAK